MQIADFVALHEGQAYAPPLQTTSAGDWVYYVNGNNFGDDRHDDIYRISSTGATFETIVQDVGVVLTTPSGCQGQADYVSSEGFSISGDGSKVLFRVTGIWNDDETCMWQYYWWVLKTPSGYTLLNPEDEVGNSGGMISPSGDKVVIADSYNYFSYNGLGTNSLAIEPRSYNYSGPAMTKYGSRYFFRDNNHLTGAIVNTNGSGLLNILPQSTYYTLTLSKIAGIDHLGNLVAFADTDDRIYAGRLHSGSMESVAPIISDITFEPAYIVEGSTEPVKVKVTTQSVVGEIDAIKIDNTDAGRFVAYGTDASHFFASNPKDDGFGADDVAGDGIFSARSSLRNNGSYDTPLKNIVRISVLDTLGNIRVVEKELNIGVFANGFE